MSTKVWDQKTKKFKWPRARKLKPGQMRDAGPHGVTRQMIDFSHDHPTNRYVPTTKTPRDRSLVGKRRRIEKKRLQRRPIGSPEQW